MKFLKSILISLTVISGFAYGEQTKLGILDTVFQQQRSEKEDVIYLRNNDVLRGEVLN